MPGQVERWLETFMCKQYAETFEAYGFKTLQSVSCSCFFLNQNGVLYFATGKLKKMRKPKLFFINSICESNTYTFSALSDSTSTIANNGSCTRTL